MPRDGARLAFGRDGKIYMAIGVPGFTERAGRAADAQDPNSYLGKILRLNEDGTVPSDNPFVNRKGYRPQIFALGIRNAIGLTSAATGWTLAFTWYAAVVAATVMALPCDKLPSHGPPNTKIREDLASKYRSK